MKSIDDRWKSKIWKSDGEEENEEEEIVVGNI